MKSAIFSIFIFIGLSILVAFNTPDKTQNNKFKTGWYFVSNDSLTGIRVNSDYYKRAFLIHPTPFLSCKYFKKLTVKDTTLYSEKMDFLEIRYNKRGARIWAKVTSRMSETEERAVFIYDDKVIIEVLASYKQKTGIYRLHNEKLSIEELREMKKGIINNCR
ncbi:hypothetical protein AAG747_04710 [Rapidithrix thailandica]|uniref:Uncharacterized protein n=1 Tax=Rapidithrix thailandica TaxID=413964 RepID=A0AAW9S8E9_9BACT